MPTKKDATSGTYAVEYNGTTYDVPAAEDWDIDVLEAFDEGKMTTGLRALLGTDQYKAFRLANRKAKQIGEFLTVAAEAVGAGNS